jgi:hypothetical protein
MPKQGAGANRENLMDKSSGECCLEAGTAANHWKVNLMLGWILIIGSAVAMGRIASSEGRSALVWGGATGLVCFLSALFIPLPLLNIGLGLVASFIALTVVKMVRKG